MEAGIRERYGRIEQPPAGRAQADEPQHDLGQELLDSESVEGAPLGAPFDAPSDGAPPPPLIPYPDRDYAPDENPDNEQYPPLPAGGRR